MSDRLAWVKCLRACINAVTDWLEMNTCQTGLLSKSMFFKFSSVLEGFIFQIFTRKTWQIIVKVMMVFWLRKTDCK